MPNSFYVLPVSITLLTMYLVCCMVSLIGFAMARTFFNHVDHRDIISKVVWQTILFFSTLFITFWMANNWHNMSDLGKLIEKEAHAVSDVYNATTDISNVEERHKLMGVTVNYLDSVINREFSSLENGALDLTTQKDYQFLIYSAYKYVPANTLHDQFNYDRLLTAIDQLSSTRIERLSFLNGELKGPLLIFFIALVLVGCFWTGCINSRNFIFSLIVIMSQNLVIASSSWLILEMDKPFQGYFKVNNQAFINAKQQIETFKF